MLILFLHGWQSTPGGVKPTCLKDHGHTVLNPALPDQDFDEAVSKYQKENPTVSRVEAIKHVSAANPKLWADRNK